MSPVRTRAATLARRAEIEASALEIVQRELAEGRSFTEISFVSIAREMEVPRSTLYMHFRDKTELLMRLGDLALDEIYNSAAAWFVFDHSSGPEAATKAGMETLAKFREHRDIALAVIEVTTYDPALADHWYAHVMEFVDRAAAALQPLQDEGRIAAGVDLKTLVFALVSMVERTATVHIRHGDPADDERIASSVGRAVWLAIYGDA